MSFQFSTAVRNAAADAIETITGTAPTLELRTGAPPADCATADSGTLLASMALPSDWLAAASAGAKSLLGTWQDASANAAGTVGHFRIKQGATCHIQGVAFSAWIGSTAYSLNQYATNGGSLYRCTVAGTSAASGGPTGSGATIVDGGVTWTFVPGAAGMQIDNAVIAVSQQVTVTSFTITAGGA